MVLKKIEIELKVKLVYITTAQNKPSKTSQ